jgi:hypothetical protein
MAESALPSPLLIMIEAGSTCGSVFMPMRYASGRPLVSSSWWRGLLVLVTAAAVGLGSAAPHNPAAEVAGGFVRVEIAETADHPEEPAHFESSRIEIHPGCMACLAQIQAGSAPILLPAARPLLAEAGRVVAAADQVPSREIRCLGPARAPPVLSPSA